MQNKIIPLLQSLSISNKTTSLSQLADNFNLNILQLINIFAIINANHQLIDYSDFSNIQLSKKINWLDLNRLKQSLPNYQIDIINPITSTNDYIKKHLRSLNNNYLLLSEYQTKGRGRNSNKSWESKIAHDLTFSLLKIVNNKSNYSLITLVSAIAIINTLIAFNLKYYIKWPNDILDENYNKIAGILVESITKNHKTHIIIGIGIDNNTNINRNDLVIKFITEFELLFAEFSKNGFDNLHAIWLNYCIHLNQPVYLFDNKSNVITGINTTVDMKGNLEVLTQENQVKKFNSSQISLRLSL
jgi:biotin-(acetyl-CoA carboxylase) ligase